MSSRTHSLWWAGRWHIREKVTHTFISCARQECKHNLSLCCVWEDVRTLGEDVLTTIENVEAEANHQPRSILRDCQTGADRCVHRCANAPNFPHSFGRFSGDPQRREACHHPLHVEIAAPVLLPCTLRLFSINHCCHLRAAARGQSPQCATPARRLRWCVRPRLSWSKSTLATPPLPKLLDAAAAFRPARVPTSKR